MRTTPALILALAATARADDLVAVADAHVWSTQPALNYGSDPNLFLSANYVVGTMPREFYRAYLLWGCPAAC